MMSRVKHDPLNPPYLLLYLNYIEVFKRITLYPTCLSQAKVRRNRK